MDKWYLTVDPDSGTRHYVCRDAGRLPPRWRAGIDDRPVALPRAPADGEYWDTELGAFVMDHAVAADMAVAVKHKPAVHLIKTIEASLVLSGVTLTHGLLAEEAEDAGIPIEQLAADVHERSAGLRDIEISRRQGRRRGR